jgi:hypothetical protein
MERTGMNALIHMTRACAWTLGTFMALTAASARAQGREVWVSPKGPAKTNAVGTLSDPYQCPDALSLGSVMESIPARSAVHFLPGTFSVTNGIAVKPGWKLRGAGIDVTTLQLVPGHKSAGPKPGVIGGMYGYYATDGVEVSDLTVDCNLQNQAGFAASAVLISGNNTRISRVRGINWGSTVHTLECFVLLIFSHQNNGPRTNCVIEDCIVEQPAPVKQVDGTTAIAILAAATGPAGGDEDSKMLGCEIRGCIVSGVTSGTDAPGSPLYINAYGVEGPLHIRLHDNRAVNIIGGAAVYSDSGNDRDITVDNNLFENVTHGIYWNVMAHSKHSSRAKFLNNIMMIAEGGTGIKLNGGYSGHIPKDVYAKDWIIKDNIIHPCSVATNVTGIALNGNFSGTVLNNVIQGGGRGQEISTDPTNVALVKYRSFAGNVNLAGKTLNAAK